VSSQRLRPQFAALAFVLLASPALGQSFTSGSDGSDGALTFAEDAGVIEFDPATFDPPLDPDGDNVYHFTTITIPSGTRVRLAAPNLGGEGKPVVWLASGDVVIEGAVDLDGEPGHGSSGPALPSTPGAGGYGGGRGSRPALPARSGNGPGGGIAAAADVDDDGSSAGHATASDSIAYGNEFVRPLLGGSGGAGENSFVNGGLVDGCGGGAGGGALLLASSTRIRVDGLVTASGGTGGPNGSQQGGAGSGGALRLVAPDLEGSGRLRALGAGGDTQPSSDGRIRLEALRYSGPLDVEPSPSVSSPAAVLPSPTAPLIRVTTVDGVTVASDPTGSFAQADVTINATGDVTIELEAENVPPGTVLELTLRPETGSVVTTTSTALQGTLASSTATATASFASGFTRLFVQATWTP